MTSWLFSLSPLESLADLAVVVGGVGLLSGVGGEYWFCLPVITYSTGWGADHWNSTNPLTEGTFMDDPDAYLRASITILFGLDLQTLNCCSTDKNGKKNTGFAGSCSYDNGSGKNFDIIGCVDLPSVHYGPLGRRSGFIMLGLFVGGMLSRAGLWLAA